MGNKYYFSGWATKNDTKCSDGRIIRHNADRLDKTIVAHKPCNNNPVLMRHASDERIAAMVKSECKRYGADNVAVIARTNPALEKFALVLDEAGVDHTSPKDYLVDDKVFGVLRDVLKVGLNGGGRATESFARLYQEFVAPISFFDAAYECFVSDPSLPRSIYEIEGARKCIETNGEKYQYRLDKLNGEYKDKIDAGDPKTAEIIQDELLKYAKEKLIDSKILKWLVILRGDYLYHLKNILKHQMNK